MKHLAAACATLAITAALACSDLQPVESPAGLPTQSSTAFTGFWTWITTDGVSVAQVGITYHVLELMTDSFSQRMDYLGGYTCEMSGSLAYTSAQLTLAASRTSGICAGQTGVSVVDWTVSDGGYTLTLTGAMAGEKSHVNVFRRM